MHIEAPTGEDFEKQVFGFTRDEVRHRIHVENRKDIATVRKVQHLFPWNPSAPSTKPARAFYKRVQSQLNTSQQKKKLKLCWAIGTELDSAHGTDCFFVCGSAVVTVDLTISPRGKSKPKADVVLRLADFTENKYYQIADDIARRLLAQAA